MFKHPRRSNRFVLAICIWAALSIGCRGPITHGDAQLPNFQMVNSSLYRGGQPTHDGLARLHDMGVKTVVNVRQGDTDHDLLDGLDFDYERRSMSAFSPCDEDVIWFLRIATDPSRGPVFLHCYHGSDRTGYLVAMFRIVVEGWDAERAIAEMTADGNGFYPLFGNLIAYIRKADVPALRTAILKEYQDSCCTQ